MCSAPENNDGIKTPSTSKSGAKLVIDAVQGMGGGQTDEWLSEALRRAVLTSTVTRQVFERYSYTIRTHIRTICIY